MLISLLIDIIIATIFYLILVGTGILNPRTALVSTILLLLSWFIFCPNRRI